MTPGWGASGMLGARRAPPKCAARPRRRVRRSTPSCNPSKRLSCRPSEPVRFCAPSPTATTPLTSYCIRPSTRARSTACRREPTDNLMYTFLRCHLMVSPLTSSELAISLFGMPLSSSFRIAVSLDVSSSSRSRPARRGFRRRPQNRRLGPGGRHRSPVRPSSAWRSDGCRGASPLAPPWPPDRRLPATGGARGNCRRACARSARNTFTRRSRGAMQSGGQRIGDIELPLRLVEFIARQRGMRPWRWRP